MSNRLTRVTAAVLLSALLSSSAVAETANAQRPAFEGITNAAHAVYEHFVNNVIVYIVTTAALCVPALYVLRHLREAGHNNAQGGALLGLGGAVVNQMGRPQGHNPGDQGLSVVDMANRFRHGYCEISEETPFWTPSEELVLTKLIKSISSEGPKVERGSGGASHMFLMHANNGRVEHRYNSCGTGIMRLPTVVRLITERVVQGFGYGHQRCLIEVNLVDNFAFRKARAKHGWSVAWHRDRCAGSSHELILIICLHTSNVPEHNFLLGVRAGDEEDDTELDNDKIKIVATIPVKPRCGYAICEDHEPWIFHATDVFELSPEQASRQCIILRIAGANEGHLEEMEDFYRRHGLRLDQVLE